MSRQILVNEQYNNKQVVFIRQSGRWVYISVGDAITGGTARIAVEDWVKLRMKIATSGREPGLGGE